MILTVGAGLLTVTLTAEEVVIAPRSSGGLGSQAVAAACATLVH